MVPLIKPPLSIYVSLLALGASLPQGQAQDSVNAGQTNPPAFRASLRNEEVIGTQPVKRVYVNFGTNEFAFVVPEGYRVDASAPEKITLVKNDYTCSISLRFSRPKAVPAGPLQADTVRQTVLECYPGAKIREEFSQSAANHSGPAFDLQYYNASGGLQSARVVFIPFGVGLIEFALLSQPDHLANGQYAFDSLLLTFCSNQDGKLTITRIPAES